MSSDRYAQDVLTGDWRRRTVVPVVAVELDLVVEDAASGFCGAVVELGSDIAGATVTLEDRHGKRRIFPLLPAAFLLEGAVTTLARPERPAGPVAPRLTASGSLAVAGHQARVALPSRIYVEGVHDAELVERVWGDDLRIEGVAVEPLHGIDDLAAVVRDFRPTAARRLGVLVDHLVPGSKESRIAAEVRDPNVKVVGHPYVDVWQAVKPSSLGIARWPSVPHGRPWKDGVCAALGWGEPADGWRRVRSAVHSYADLEPELLGRVEELIDFVTA
ncbi:MAG: hypothetical protein QOE24_3030 [Frankiales bacterium]|jgi:hypothetical protein|nr:hypothetical protein [Frankiales bacterium]